MALNKVRLLDEDELLKLLNENGYEDISKILNGRDIDGKKFFELSEYQTKFWRLTALQKRTLFSFITEVKENPSIIIKKEPVTKLAKINQPALNLHVSPKSPLPKIPQKKNSPITTGQNDFKQKLGLILSTNPPPTILSNSTVSSNVSIPLPRENNLPRSPKPPPIKPIPELPNKTSQKSKNYSPAPPSPNESIHSKPFVSEENKKYKSIPPLPPPIESIPKLTFKSYISEPDNKISLPESRGNNQSLPTTKPKPKPLPVEPIEIKAKFKPPLPTPINQPENKPLKDENSSTNFEIIYENIKQPDQSSDYGYLSPNELEFGYVNANIAQIHAESTKALNKNVPKSTINHDIVIEPHEPVPIRPKISRKLSPHSIENTQRKVQPKYNEHKPENVKKSPVAERPRLPLPKGQNYKQFTSLEDLGPKTDERKMRTVEAYLDLDTISIPEATSSKPTSDSSLISNNKLKVQDLQNVLIVEEEQSKRPNNFIETLSRFFTKKETKTEYPIQNYNYENHMLHSEVPSLIKMNDQLPYKNRPLPEIPKPEVENPLPNRSFSFSKPDLKVYISPSEENQESSISENTRRIRNLSDPQGQAYIEMTQHSSNNHLIYENIKSKSTENVTRDNLEFKKNDSSSTNRLERKKSLKLNFDNKLALELSKVLRDRDANKLPHHSNINHIKTPPGSEDEDFTDGIEKHVYGNISSRRSPRQYNLQLTKTNSPSSRTNNVPDENDDDDDDDDEFDETPPPYYVNIDESETLNMREENPIEEEDSEYVGTIFNLNNEKFYRNTDRKGAKELLHNFPDGAFLFRPSQKYFLVLTLKYKGKCYNLGIERTQNNKIRLHADTSSISPEFGTLQAFADYFTHEAVTFRDNDNSLVEIYLDPILPANLF